MARQRSDVMGLGERSPEWGLRYQTEWGLEVGSRVRQLRQAAGLRLLDVTGIVRRPDGGGYSTGYFSRMERGWATPSLWVYEHLATQFGVHPGKLLGTDDLQKSVTDGEVTLIMFLRRMGIAPDEALQRVVRPTPSAGTSARPAF